MRCIREILESKYLVHLLDAIILKKWGLKFCINIGEGRGRCGADMREGGAKVEP